MKIRYIILLAVATFFLLIAGLIFSNQQSASIELSQPQFSQMLSEGDIEEVVLVSNQGIVEVTLSEQARQKPVYFEELAGLSPFAAASGPHYQMEINSPEIFDREFTEAQEGLPQSEKIGYQLQERTGPLSVLLNWGFLFFLVIIFYGTVFILPIAILLRRRRRTAPQKHETIPDEKTPQQSLKALDVPATTITSFPHKLGDRVLFTPTEDIACFFAQNNHVYLYDVLGKEYLVEYTLAELEKKLPPHFMRVHRSYIINVYLIQEVKRQPGGRFVIKLQGEKHKEIVSGQSYATPVKQLLEI